MAPQGEITLSGHEVRWKHETAASGQSATPGKWKIRLFFCMDGTEELPWCGVISHKYGRAAHRECSSDVPQTADGKDTQTYLALIWKAV